MKDVSAVDLNLKMTGGIISCEGWSGCVAIGRLYGQAVAVKFAYLNTERAEVSRSCITWEWCIERSKLLYCGLIQG